MSVLLYHPKVQTTKAACNSLLSTIPQQFCNNTDAATVCTMQLTQLCPARSS